MNIIRIKCLFYFNLSFPLRHTAASAKSVTAFASQAVGWLFNFSRNRPKSEKQIHVVRVPLPNAR